MGIICIFKCSFFHCDSPSHPWWPCRRLDREKDALGLLVLLQPDFGQWVPALLKELAFVIQYMTWLKGLNLWQQKRDKWCSYWVENTHHLPPEPCRSTLRLLGLWMWQKKQSWVEALPIELVKVLYSEMLHFALCIYIIFLRQARCISHSKLRGPPSAVTIHISQCGTLHFKGSKAYAPDRKLSQM